MDFLLRPWAPTDLEDLVRYANNYEIAKNLMDRFPYPYTPANGEAFIKVATLQKPYHILAIEVKGEAAGSIGIHPLADIERKNAELGYWLAQPYWGNGIITKAVVQMVEYGFKNWDINRIFARPFGDNIASQRVLEKAGFALEARLENTLFKFGEYHDELIYAIRKEEVG